MSGRRPIKDHHPAKGTTTSTPSIGRLPQGFPTLDRTDKTWCQGTNPEPGRPDERASNQEVEPISKVTWLMMAEAVVNTIRRKLNIIGKTKPLSSSSRGLPRNVFKQWKRKREEFENKWILD